MWNETISEVNVGQLNGFRIMYTKSEQYIYICMVVICKFRKQGITNRSFFSSHHRAERLLQKLCSTKHLTPI